MLELVDIITRMKELQNAREGRNKLHEALCKDDPQLVCDAGIRLYDETGVEGYLLQTILLLEAMGPAAWSTLHKLAIEGKESCELFISLIASCEGIIEDYG